MSPPPVIVAAPVRAEILAAKDYASLGTYAFRSLPRIGERVNLPRYDGIAFRVVEVLHHGAHAPDAEAAKMPPLPRILVATPEELHASEMAQARQELDLPQILQGPAKVAT